MTAAGPEGLPTDRKKVPIAAPEVVPETPWHPGELGSDGACGDWTGVRAYTVGHSTRTQEEMVELLRGHGVATLVDIRKMPRSRHNPQFNLEVLAEAMPAAGIGYAHLSRLGGLRRGSNAASPNGGWRNAGFRAYADYMQTEAFAEGLAELRAIAEAGPVALMCAEAVPWRCHRSLVADALTVRGVEVREIASPTRATVHTLPSFARAEGCHLTYPPADPEADVAPPEEDAGA